MEYQKGEEVLRLDSFLKGEVHSVDRSNGVYFINQENGEFVYVKENKLVKTDQPIAVKVDNIHEQQKKHIRELAYIEFLKCAIRENRRDVTIEKFEKFYNQSHVQDFLENYRCSSKIIEWLCVQIAEYMSLNSEKQSSLC
ncbi:MAG: hypothetical protein ACOCQR_00795 [bacterium]